MNNDSIMNASSRRLRRILARSGTTRRNGARLVPMVEVSKLAAKRTDSTRRNAVRQFAEKGQIPKRAYKPRPMAFRPEMALPPVLVHEGHSDALCAQHKVA